MAESTQFGISYSQARYVSFESVTRNRVHRHSYFEPCIVISGNGEFEHGAEVFPLAPGDLFLAERGTYHEIRSLESRDLRLYFLAFNVVRGDIGIHGRAPVDPERIVAFLSGHRVHLAGQSHLVPLFEHVTRLVRRNPAFEGDRDYHDATGLLLRQLITSLTDTARLSDEAYVDQLRRRRVEDFIESNLHLPIRVPQIAAACAVSERTLRRLWASWSERSVAEDLRHRRMARAAQLLALPDMAIADVGIHVGIESPAQFSRQFKQIVGLTPNVYRRQVLAGLGGDMPAGQALLTEYRGRGSG